MRKSHVTIYDLQMRKVAMLENAVSIGYETPINVVWLASFSLPLNDPKNEYCQPFHYVEIFDGNERLELFRILPTTAQRTEQTQYIRYTCEHVLATLLDDVVFQQHTVGNLGVYTSDVIAYVLARQTTKHWQLGTVDFNRQYEYNWENTNLLAALFSVPRPFTDPTQWTFDTTSYPWKLNLVAPSDRQSFLIRYRKNMRGITRKIDPTGLTNRIYALGFGEGVNQLSIAEVNDGLPYVEDADSIAHYGLKATVWADRRFVSAETLKAQAEALLKAGKEPRVTYEIGAAEFYAITGDPEDRFHTGAIGRIQDPDLGDLELRLVNVKKSNVLGAPGDVTLEFSTRPKDIAGTITDLANRMKIEEVYAQGATSSIHHDFMDNCDASYPAVMRFWLPEETARINKMRLTYRAEPFRAYSRAIAAAPANTTGSSTRTTAGPSTRSTSGSSNATTTGPSTANTTGPVNITGSTQTEGTYTGTGGHNHGIVPGTRLSIEGGGYVTWVPSGNHSHPISLQNHEHPMAHNHEMDHFHQMDHTHDMDHFHEIPSHTHAIQHGIFVAPTLPTTVSVKVDGQTIPDVAVSEEELDIIPYLSKDGSGKVERGKWHTIEIAPNGIGRIVANIFGQIFMASRGGGDY